MSRLRGISGSRYGTRKHLIIFVYVGIFYIQAERVLHLVHKASRYQTIEWLLNVSIGIEGQTGWLCWMDLYLGSPDIVVYDAGKQFRA